MLLPLGIGFFAIPILIDKLGHGIFGMLTLMWALVSYLGILDLGIGRALTLRISYAINDGNINDISKNINVASVLLFLVGTLVGLLLIILRDLIPEGIKSDVSAEGFLWIVISMGLCIPFTLLASGFRGVLEAYERFDIVNIIRVPWGVYTFLAPLLVVQWSNYGIVGIAVVLSLGRVLFCFIHYFAARFIVRWNSSFSIDYIKPILVSGGWMSVSNIISPLMGYIDRFIIASVLGSAFVAYYATSMEIITKIWMLPGAIGMALFPLMARYFAEKNEKLSKSLFLKSNLIIFLAVFPVALGIFCFSKEILMLWIGEDFAKNSYEILRILSVGVLINCLAHMGLVTIQSRGRSDVGAIIHLSQFPIFVFVIWLAVDHYGVIGGAIAWTLRMVLDTAFINFAALKVLNVEFQFKLKYFMLAFLVCLVFLFCYYFSGFVFLVFTVFFLVSVLCIKLAWKTYKNI